MNLLIIDDEPLVRTGLKDQVDVLFPDTFEVRMAHGLESGLEVLKDFQPDIVLLDVQMGDGTGFDWLERVPGRSFEVIFLTAHAEYAVRAFEKRASNYLLKPVAPQQLKRAIEGALEGLQREAAYQASRLQHATNGTAAKRFRFPTLEGMQFLPYAEICYVAAQGNYLKIFLDRKKNHEVLVSKPLRFFEEQMDASIFQRVHRSYIVNLAKVDAYLKSNGGFVRMRSGMEIPLSTKFKHAFLNRVGRV